MAVILIECYGRWYAFNTSDPKAYAIMKSLEQKPIKREVQKIAEERIV